MAGDALPLPPSDERTGARFFGGAMSSAADDDDDNDDDNGGDSGSFACVVNGADARTGARLVGGLNSDELDVITGAEMTGKVEEDVVDAAFNGGTPSFVGNCGLTRFNVDVDGSGCAGVTDVTGGVAGVAAVVTGVTGVASGTGSTCVGTTVVVVAVDSGLATGSGRATGGGAVRGVVDADAVGDTVASLAAAAAAAAATAVGGRGGSFFTVGVGCGATTIASIGSGAAELGAVATSKRSESLGGTFKSIFALVATRRRVRLSPDSTASSKSTAEPSPLASGSSDLGVVGRSDGSETDIDEPVLLRMAAFSASMSPPAQRPKSIVPV